MLSFTNPKHDRISHLSTQMKFRLREGNGEAFYYIGVKDDGYPQGINY
jgi:GTPase